MHGQHSAVTILFNPKQGKDNMDLASTFIIYLIMFRLAIIAVGAMSMVLGYRLFRRGVWSRARTNNATTVETKIANAGFTLKNAAPGTCFALFGVVIIATMFATGGPELTLKTMTRAGLLKSETQDSLTTISQLGLSLRGNKDESLTATTAEGIYYEQHKDTMSAIRAYEAAVAMIATPMNHLAWLYQAQGRLDEALPLSRMAAQLAPENAHFLDTLAEILFKRGERAEALQLIRKAVELDKNFQARLIEFERRQ